MYIHTFVVRRRVSSVFDAKRRPIVPSSASGTMHSVYSSYACAGVRRTVSLR